MKPKTCPRCQSGRLALKGVGFGGLWNVFTGEKVCGSVRKTWGCKICGLEASTTKQLINRT